MQSEWEERLRGALERVAELVTLYGDGYLPIFIRLEQEVEALAVDRLAAARARALVQARPHNAINSRAARRPSNAPPSP